MRLTGGAITERSGLLVCAALPPETVRVLVTAHTPKADDFGRWTQEGLVHLLQEKRRTASSRLQELKEWWTRRVPMNFGVKITFNGTPEQEWRSPREVDPQWVKLAEIIAAGSEPEHQDYPGNPANHVSDDGRRNTRQQPSAGDEVSYVFHRLLPRAIASADLVVESGGASGAGIVRATLVHEATGLCEQVIIKYALGKQLDQEKDNFEAFVLPGMTNGFAPRRWWATSRNMSAVAYAFVDPENSGSAPSFASFVRRSEYQPWDGGLMVSKIFSGICKKWYDAYPASVSRSRAYPSTAGKTLCSYLLENLWADKRSPSQIAKKLLEIEQFVSSIGVRIDENGVVTARIGETAVNTVSATRILAHQGGTGPDGQSRPMAPPPCVTHGDLHARNVFIVGNDPWIIDFGDCGWGHPLRDFAALETSLGFGVLYDYSKPELIWQLERALATAAVCPIEWGSVPEDKMLQRAADLIGKIRQEASKLKRRMERWEEQYAIVRMFCLLKLAGVNRRLSGFEDEKGIELRRLLAYLAAGETASRLGLVKIQWPTS